MISYEEALEIESELAALSPPVGQQWQQYFERSKEMFRMKLLGYSYKEIGSTYNLSHERARQIIIKLEKRIKWRQQND